MLGGATERAGIAGLQLVAVGLEADDLALKLNTVLQRFDQFLVLTVVGS